MWTVRARELMLEGIHQHTKSGAVVELFEGNRSLITLEIEGPATAIEGGALVFSQAEKMALQSGTPNRATISAGGVVLLELIVPRELEISPLDLVPGAMVQIKSIVIQ